MTTDHVLPAVSFSVQCPAVQGRLQMKEKIVELINKVCRIAWNILSVVVFPIGLTRLAIHLIAPLVVLPAARMFNLITKTRSYYFADQVLRGKKTAEQIQQEIDLLSNNQAENAHVKLQNLQGQHKKELEREQRAENLGEEMDNIIALHEKREHLLQQSKNLEQITLQTADGTEIDTLQIKNIASKKWIVVFCPNGQCYEQSMEKFMKISQDTGANIYVGNYRGVMRSKGKMTGTRDLVLDGEAMMQKLLADGIQEEDILIQGTSLGGGVAAEVAAKYPMASLCNDRSFASLVHYLKGHHPKVGGILGKIIGLAGWRFDSWKNFQKVKGKTLVIYSKKDGVIPYEGSLFRTLNKENRPAPWAIELEIDEQVSAEVPKQDIGKLMHSRHITETRSYGEYLTFVSQALNL